ncbi:MAG: ABC transporter permease, partial [Clostridia bacterium]|nr:ABC transporter permease [Clostridia bacterium]
MTQIISSDKSTKRSPSFFLRELKNNKVQFFLFTVLLFMVLPVFSLFEVTDNLNYVKSIQGTDVLRAFASPMFAAMWVMMFAGIIAGMLAFSIFQERKRAYFYLGLPVTRDRLFITRVLTGFIPAVLAYLINVLISLFIFASAKEVGFFELIPAALKLGGQTLLLFTWTYSFSVFAAILTGKAGASLLLSVWTFAILPIYQACVTFVLDIAAPSAFIPGFNEEILYVYFNPLIRTALLQEKMGDAYTRPYSKSIAVTDIDFYASFAWYEVALILLASFGILVAAFFIMRKRKAENSGETAAFFRVGEIIKITALIPSGIIFGIVFNELFGTFGFFFGIIWGMFIAFLLLNLLLYRSGKKLFVGAKWAILTAVILIPIIVITMLYGEHIEKRSYDASNTKAVTVNVHPFGDYTLDIDECGALFEALKQLDYTRGLSGNSSVFSRPAIIAESYTVEKDLGISYHYYQTGYRFTFYPKAGLAVRRHYTFDRTLEDILFDAMRASSKGGVLLEAALYPAEDETYYDRDPHFYFSYDNFPFIYPKNFTEKLESKSLDRDIAIKIASRRAEEFYNGEIGGFAIGYAYYYTETGYYVNLPIYLTDGDLFDTKFVSVEELAEHIDKVELHTAYLYEYEKEMYDKYGDVYYDAAITVTNFATLTDKEQILECLKASAGEGGSGIFNSEAYEITFHFIATYEGEIYTFSSSP